MSETQSETQTQSGVVVRRAGAGDVEGLVACSAALFAEDAGAHDPLINVDWPRVHGPERFAASVADPARLVLVAEREGEVVGHLTGALYEPTAMKPARVAELVSMYMRPEHRGGGTGGRLVAAFLAWAREEDAVEVAVTAYAANTAAIRFYERCGLAPRSVTLTTTTG